MLMDKYFRLYNHINENISYNNHCVFYNVNLIKIRSIRSLIHFDEFDVATQRHDLIVIRWLQCKIILRRYVRI